MQGIYSAYVSWNGKIAKQFVKITVKITASMTQATGSTSKLNISNQAVHALLRNGQCNEDLAARAKLYKMVCHIPYGIKSLSRRIIEMTLKYYLGRRH